jgi:hypothetical protein
MLRRREVGFPGLRRIAEGHGPVEEHSMPRFIPLDSHEKSVKPPTRAFQLAGPLQGISFNLLDGRVLTPISDGEEDSISEL